MWPPFFSRPRLFVRIAYHGPQGGFPPVPHYSPPEKATAIGFPIPRYSKFAPGLEFRDALRAAQAISVTIRKFGTQLTIAEAGFSATNPGPLPYRLQGTFHPTGPGARNVHKNR